MNKEVNDALHTLLNISLKDKSFSTQKQQFKIVYNYITNLQEENEKLKIEKQEEYNRFNLMAKFRDKALERTFIYKSRNEKAIEYISEHLEREYFDYDILETNTIYNRDLFKVKNILQGDDTSVRD